MWVCPFLDELWDLFVLGNRTELTANGEQSHIGHGPYELAVLGEVPPAAPVPGMLMVV